MMRPFENGIKKTIPLAVASKRKPTEHVRVLIASVCKGCSETRFPGITASDGDVTHENIICVIIDLLIRRIHRELVRDCLQVLCFCGRKKSQESTYML
ncbi:hypothetical protein U0070_002551 [Myodes glareolus]|uniref:Uncharacterized protein n=1 Tax=Myodes glareolus TaxID=447135 RepID=A0AAW0I5X8_MYOGA